MNDLSYYVKEGFMKIGNTHIEVIEDVDKVNLRNNLITLYDVFNNIANETKTKRKDLFLTEKQVRLLNKDTANIFI